MKEEEYILVLIILSIVFVTGCSPSTSQEVTSELIEDVEESTILEEKIEHEQEVKEPTLDKEVKTVEEKITIKNTFRIEIPNTDCFNTRNLLYNRLKRSASCTIIIPIV